MDPDEQEILCPRCGSIMEWMPIPDPFPGGEFCPECDEEHPQFEEYGGKKYEGKS